MSRKTGAEHIDTEKIKRAVRLFLEAIGEDVKRPGLVETPDRVARMCKEVFYGTHTDPVEVIKVLDSPGHDEIVLVKDISLYSICEHHLLPFLGKAHVAYIPDGGRLCGISKLARVVEVASRRLNVQEHLTTVIADTIMKALQPKGVLVVLEAEHLCMTMRGVSKPGAKTITSVVRGIFRERPATRAEVLSLIHGAPRTA
ncbi:MAG: GTP cyclohydrolase I FolE [Planctomycetota bacterium]